jgi:ComF family protein
MLTRLLERSPFLKGMLDFVYPPLCAGCGEYLEGEQAVCPACMARIDWYSEPIALTPFEFNKGSDQDPITFPLFAAGDYSDPLREVVIQLKFRGVKAVVPMFADKLAEQFGEKIQRLSPAYLLPIPLHPSREYIRGYNQAALIAQALGKRLDLPVAQELLARSKKRRAQAKLRRAERARNIRGVFEFIGDRPSAQECDRIILVDDVVTSGQTVFEARRVLTLNGYQVVGAISIAHGL